DEFAARRALSEVPQHGAILPRGRGAGSGRDAIVAPKLPSIGLNVSSPPSEGLFALHVVALVVVLILTAAHVVEPVLVVAIPLDGVGQALVGLHLRRPAEFALELGAVDRVTKIVAGTIGDELDQALRLA